MSKNSDKRERLVNAAATLFHHYGYSRTSLSDIAKRSRVPLGNVYYYFKSKDELIDAVVHERFEDMQALFDHCEQNAEPQQRLRCFLDYIVSMRRATTRYGCPIGGLCQELNKEATELANMAETLLSQSLQWVTAQFKAMGHKDADKMAEHFLVITQGASLLANTFGKETIIEDEVKRTQDWIQSI